MYKKNENAKHSSSFPDYIHVYKPTKRFYVVFMLCNTYNIFNMILYILPTFVGRFYRGGEATLGSSLLLFHPPQFLLLNIIR